MKSTLFFIATVLILATLSCLTIGFATYLKFGSVDWQFIQVVAALLVGILPAVWILIWAYNVILPLSLWVSWKYFCLLEKIVGFELGTFFRKQVVTDPSVAYSQRGTWPFLYRAMIQDMQVRGAND